MKKKGLTIVEILTVIAIIAVLAGVMPPLLRSFHLEAQLAKVAMQQETIKSATLMLHFDTGEWPAVTNIGWGLVNSNGVTNVADWDGPYMDTWTKDPWGSYYYILKPPSTTEVLVYSKGPDCCMDGAEGGDDIVLLITSDRNQ